MIELSQLRTFLAVADASSFTRAAESLCLSQPAVSVQVKNLEARCGTALFDRLGRRVVLTEAGRVLADYAKRMLALGEDAESALQELAGLATGTVVVAASTLPGTYLLPKAIGEFASRYPGVKVTLMIEDTRTALRRVIDNEADLGVIGQTEVPPGIESLSLLEDELVLIVSPRHPLAKRSRVSLDDVRQEPFVCRETGSGTREVVEQAFAAHGVSRRVAMAFGTVDAVKQAVMAGLGVAVVSRYAVELETGARRLRALSLSEPSLRRTIDLVFRRGKRLSPATRAFIAWLRQAREAEGA